MGQNELQNRGGCEVVRPAGRSARARHPDPVPGAARKPCQAARPEIGNAVASDVIVDQHKSLTWRQPIEGGEDQLVPLAWSNLAHIQLTRSVDLNLDQ